MRARRRCPSGERRLLVQVDEFEDGALFERRIVGAGEAVEIVEGQAAPGRAQNGEPRDAIHGMNESAGEREEVEQFLAFGEALDFNRAEGDAAAAEQRDELGQMGPGADEDSDPVFLALGARRLDGGQLLLEDAENVLRFVAAGPRGSHRAWGGGRAVPRICG